MNSFWNWFEGLLAVAIWAFIIALWILKWG